LWLCRSRESGRRLPPIAISRRRVSLRCLTEVPGAHSWQRGRCQTSKGTRAAFCSNLRTCTGVGPRWNREILWLGAHAKPRRRENKTNGRHSEGSGLSRSYARFAQVLDRMNRMDRMPAFRDSLSVGSREIFRLAHAMARRRENKTNRLTAREVRRQAFEPSASRPGMSFAASRLRVTPPLPLIQRGLIARGGASVAIL
jgi:hypothetical protein